MLDPITTAVIRHRLYYANVEMSEVMLRTAYSQILNSSRDFSIGILDGVGRLISQADNLPVHVGGLPFAMQAVLEKFEGRINPGDIYIVNDPYHGGSHLPDITCFLPVFEPGEDRPTFWAANRSHSSDIGGSAAGSYNPAASEIWHEGLRIPPIRLYHQGSRDDDLLYLLATNVRHFRDFEGDLEAMVGSVRIGAERLGAILSDYERDTVFASLEAILDASEKETRDDLRTWKNGRYKGVSILDDDGHGARDIHIRATVDVHDDCLTIDLSETDDQVQGIVNSSFANTVSAVRMAIAYLTPAHIAKNEGVFRTIDVITRKGSLVDPFAPAPVTLSTNHPAQEIAEAVIKALAEACPDRVVAGWGRRFRIALEGTNPQTGKQFIWHLFQARPGGGASAHADGWNGAGELSSGGGLKFGSIEVSETRFPLFFEEHEFAPETAGNGKHRGGFGSRLRLRLETTQVANGVTAGDGRNHAPHGLEGGHPGTPHSYLHVGRDGKGEELPTKAVGLRFQPGDRLVITSSGGGGFGDPKDRDPALLQKDISEGYTGAGA